MRRLYAVLPALCAALGAAHAAPTAELNLAPWPKVVVRTSGWFRPAGAVLSVTAGEQAQAAAGALAAVLGRNGRASLRVQPAAGPRQGLTLGTPSAWAVGQRAADRAGGYRLEVTPRGASVGAADAAGLLNGCATLTQLITANSRDGALPSVRIEDWPSIAHRGFLDDITRGPSPTLTALRRQAAIGASLKLNVYTWYLEHQFAYPALPDIGPRGGSLLPSELRELDRAAWLQGVELVGCQQSFGHFGNILNKPAYKPLAETPDVLNPLLEGSYGLLGEMYEAQAPLLRSKLFNVCCDETWGLGTGPTKEEAARIGVGGIYVGHVRKVHDLLRDRFSKRMMMWGDIILQHPDKLDQIPKDTVMLSWGYDPRPSFDEAILPFAKAGYEFWVCPGTNCWSRILPDFASTAVNVRNYVRDGAKHGASGVLNTNWLDDGEALLGGNWYGIAWGAECSWNASATPRDAFDRRLGAVLFGVRDARFGRAIRRLETLHAMPGLEGLMNSRFWRPEAGGPLRSGLALAERIDAVALPALRDLRAVRQAATTNQWVLDDLILQVERVQHLSDRRRLLCRAAEAWQTARMAPTGSPAARDALARSGASLHALEGRLRGLRERFTARWLSQFRPYYLDRTLARYDAALREVAAARSATQTALAAAASGKAMPEPPALLPIAAVAMQRSALAPSRAASVPPAPWALPGAARRLPVLVATAGNGQSEQPMAIELPAGVLLHGPFTCVEAATDAELPCQVDAEQGRRILRFLAPGSPTGGGERLFHVYSGGPEPAATAMQARRDGAGFIRVENGKLSLRFGAEGGHIFRWCVDALGGLDLTEPGDTGWAGFADVNGVARTARNELTAPIVGPAMVRIVSRDPAGLTKTFEVWAGADWVDCTLTEPTTWFACYDDISVMGAETARPGRSLFEDGHTTALKPLSNAPGECQESRSSVRWAAKFAPGGALIALLTPEGPSRLTVGPGGGMGAVFADWGAPCERFVMVGGPCPPDPAAQLNSLRAALDARHPPRVALGEEEAR
jgi:hypothetical protein